MALALGCAALAAAVAFVFARRRGRGPGEALVVSWLAVLALAYVFIAQVAVALWRESVVMSWHLPDLATSFGFYLDALALFAAAVGGTVVVLALTAWAWWTRRRTAG
jgi:NADH:ubiquinone oxidoreductase subunit 5 (subunit L)/multisubunit Na+/H+ antiporter MnhA subunit